MKTIKTFIATCVDFVNIWTTGRRTIENSIIKAGHPICEFHIMHNNKQKANANLIAAAPDILEACKNLIKALDNCPGTFNYSPELEDKVRMAITKPEH